MFAEDWERLGLGPTRDLIAIKKAYAVRLRSTRPDDDAEAYQALRASYERAQYWARHVHDDDEAAGDVEDAAVEDAAPPTSAGPTAQPAPEPRHEPLHGEATGHTDEDFTLGPHETPEALVNGAYHLWRQHGEQALLSGWPSLEAALDRLPLDRRPEASARFADLLISVHDLPAGFAHRLQDHFGWSSDFRIDRMIGPQRAEALRQVLQSLAPRPITDPELLAPLADLRLLRQLIDGKRRTLAWLHAMLLGWPLEALRHRVEPRVLRGVGIGPVDLVRLDSLLETTLWSRVGLVAALLAVATVWRMGGDTLAALGPVALTAAGSLGVFGLSMVLGSFLSALLRHDPDTARRPVRALLRWRNAHDTAMVGALMLAGAIACLGGVFHASTPPWMHGAGLALAAAGVVAGWPALPTLSAVVLPTAGLLGMCLLHLFGPTQNLWIVACSAGVATLIAASHAAAPWGRLFNQWLWTVLPVMAWFSYRMGPQLKQPGGITWVAALACTFAASFMTMALAYRQGPRTALAPMGLAVGMTMAIAMDGGASPSQGLQLLFVWTALLALFIVLTRGAAWLDRVVFRRMRDAL
jgi:hypothetical protein